jgi:uncharacterized membrane-anchored protein
MKIAYIEFSKREILWFKIIVYIAIIIGASFAAGLLTKEVYYEMKGRDVCLQWLALDPYHFVSSTPSECSQYAGFR